MSTTNTVTMYDSTNVSAIPGDAEAVAGYTAGRYVTYPTLLKRFPKAHVLSIAVASRWNADVGDFENGDIPNTLAPAWVAHQLARKDVTKDWKPTVYTSVSNAKALIDLLNHAGIKRNQYRLWTAHYTGKPHLCGPGCGFGLATNADATQYTDHALGRVLDASLCREDFFGPVPKAKGSDARKKAIWRQNRAKASKERTAVGKEIRAQQAHSKLLDQRIQKLDTLINRKLTR